MTTGEFCVVIYPSILSRAAERVAVQTHLTHKYLKEILQQSFCLYLQFVFCHHGELKQGCCCFFDVSSSSLCVLLKCTRSHPRCIWTHFKRNRANCMMGGFWSGGPGTLKVPLQAKTEIRLKKKKKLNRARNQRRVSILKETVRINQRIFSGKQTAVIIITGTSALSHFSVNMMTINL